MSAAAGARVSGRRLDRLFVYGLLLVGLVGVIAGVSLLALLVLGRLPSAEERTVFAASMIAAAVAALLYQPARRGLERIS